MAKLRNIDKIFTLNTGERVTVGNNRTIEKALLDGAMRYVCRLHGSPIMTAALGSNGHLFVTLDDCGYRTRTTAQALQDFAAAFGARLGVSIAGGDLSIHWYQDGWKERKALDGRAAITLDRYA